jgi:AcrR family transcriptional regulator
MPSRRTRPPLTPERILRVAVTLADRDGIDALSMRSVAREVGFEVMSLYNHVANKDAMLDGMLELVAAEFPRLGVRPVDRRAASPARRWRPELDAFVRGAHEVLLRHPWAVAEWSRRFPGPHRLDFAESLLRAFRDADFGADLAYHGYHAILLHLLGFTAQELSYASLADHVDEIDDFLGAVSPEQYPHFTEHIGQHLDPDHHADDFGFGLDLILDGLERARRRR